MVNKKIIFFMLSIPFLLPSTLNPAAGEDSNTTTQTCATGNLMNMSGSVSCDLTGVIKNSSSLNAVGDLVNWPLAENVSVLSIGKLTESISKRVTFPAHGKMVRLSLIPSKGELANEKIEVLFVGFDVKKPLPLDAPSNISTEIAETRKLLPWANAIVKIYRRVSPEKQWTEIAMTETSASDPSTLDAADITFSPDGTATMTTTRHKDAFTGEIITSKIIVPLGSIY